MTAFGPVFIHSSAHFDLGRPGGDFTACVHVEHHSDDSGTAAPIEGHILRIVEITIVPNAAAYYSDWAPLSIKPEPKDPRRWFDGFRTAWQAPSPRGNQPATRPWRHQSRADGQQRRRHKRKLFLESIRG